MTNSLNIKCETLREYPKGTYSVSCDIDVQGFTVNGVVVVALKGNVWEIQDHFLKPQAVHYKAIVKAVINHLGGLV